LSAEERRDVRYWGRPLGGPKIECAISTVPLFPACLLMVNIPYDVCGLDVCDVEGKLMEGGGNIPPNSKVIIIYVIDLIADAVEL